MGHERDHTGWTRSMSTAAVSHSGLCLLHITWLPQLLRDAKAIKIELGGKRITRNGPISGKKSKLEK